MIAWNSRFFVDNDYLLFLGISLVFIASIDFVHLLAYQGINIFSGFDANLPTQLWIAARYLQALSFLVAPIFIIRELKPKLTSLIYFIITSFIFVSIFYLRIFPDAFIVDSGLTQFKIISEYIISIILIGSIVFLWEYKEKFDKIIFYLIISSIIFTIFAELAFTFYVSVFGLSNLVGHFFKIISFYLIYKAIIQIGLMNPYSLLSKKKIKRKKNGFN